MIPILRTASILAMAPALSSCLNDISSTQGLISNDEGLFYGSKAIELQLLDRRSNRYELSDKVTHLPGDIVRLSEDKKTFVIDPRNASEKSSANLIATPTYRGFFIISINGDIAGYAPTGRHVYYLAYRLGNRLYTWGNLVHRSLKLHNDMNANAISASILGIAANDHKEYAIGDRETLDDMLKTKINLIRSQRLAPDYIFAFSPI